MARLSLRLSALRSNLDAITAFCTRHKLDFLFVTKVFQSKPALLAAFGRPDLKRIADVHAANFRHHDPAVYPHRAVLRPRFGDVEAVAEHATRVFVSDPTLAQRLKDCIYRVGNTREPGQAYRDFRGRDPEVQALLIQRGLV